MKALVTGASSGIGKAIACALETENYKVIRVSRSSGDFSCDLRVPSQIEALAKKIDNLDLLVNCAGVGFYGVHESLSTQQISNLVRTNLEGAMILTNLMLPKLRKSKGTIFNITSVTADQINTHGAAYGATKAALSSFTKSLFAEVRKHGVRCVDIKPDMCATSLYKNADFDVSDDPLAYLKPEDVANACITCIKQPAITELKLQPQKHQIKRK